MSLLWTCITTLLYAEIFFTILLLLPFISAYRWSRIFNSRMFISFRDNANMYFNFLFAVLLVILIQAIRDTQKYTRGHDAHSQSTSDMGRASSTIADMKMFRAQRNLYISGFALFLWMVLRRMLTLVCEHAEHDAMPVAITEQAERDAETAGQRKENTYNKANEKEERSAVAGELEKTKKELIKTYDEITCIQKDFDAMKKQAESTNKEYDQLVEENRRLQQKHEKLEGQEGSKKGN